MTFLLIGLALAAGFNAVVAVVLRRWTRDAPLLDGGAADVDALVAETEAELAKVTR